MTSPEGGLSHRVDQFDSHFGNRTGIRRDRHPICFCSARGIQFCCKPITLVRKLEIKVEFVFSGPAGGKHCRTEFRHLISISYEACGVGDWFAVSRRSLHHYTIDNPFLQLILREGGFCFFPYIQYLWRFLHLSKPFSDHLIFPIFTPFILCLAPDSPFCWDLVRNSSGKLYPCHTGSYAKSTFWWLC